MTGSLVALTVALAMLAWPSESALPWWVQVPIALGCIALTFCTLAEIEGWGRPTAPQAADPFIVREVYPWLLSEDIREVASASGASWKRGMGLNWTLTLRGVEAKVSITDLEADQLSRDDLRRLVRSRAEESLAIMKKIENNT